MISGMEHFIPHLLDHERFSAAVRMAEIYHAENNNEDSLFMLAFSYLKSGKHNSVYHILSRANFNHPKIKLLFGQCCYKLGKFHEAERCLLNQKASNNINIASLNLNSNNMTQSAPISCNTTIRDQLVDIYGTDAPSAAFYLGSIFEKTSRPSEAVEFHRISLDLNPYSWDSAEALARLVDENSNFNSRTNFLANSLSKFKLNSDPITKQNDHLSSSHQQRNHTISNNLPSQLPVMTTVIANHCDSSTATPSSNNILSKYKTPRAPQAIKKEPRRSTRFTSLENNSETPVTRPIVAGMNAPAKKMMRRMPATGTEIPLDPKDKLVLECYRALDCLSHYKLDQSISIFESLPEKHRNTAWVLTSIGRAHYEKTNYTESVKYYEAARKLEPNRVEGMEYYSSALWHLHREIELSVLAKELVELDQNAPQTWCVAGNCYSLQKEHESAIKYLEKAIKVDPNFAYAYTLLGHELISAERLDQAMTYFRNAVRLDPKHWNAWCGLGSIYYKNEQYTTAEIYYSKALKIAPTNPVLMCQLAVVQHVCKRSQAAIDTLTKALEIDPDNALCRFHRASIYSVIDRNDDALHELEQLKHLVPKESMVYFLIGKIHKKTGNFHTALMNFSWAMELDPKGANNTIREVIDKQHGGEDDVVVHCD